MELKVRYNLDGHIAEHQFQSHLYGIESRDTGTVFQPVRGFNRTFMELKVR